jgi:hypothetical protein
VPKADARRFLMLVIPMISKPLDQIIRQDITELCARGAYENQVLEFKQELPGDRGRPDPWMTGMLVIGSFAK